VGALPKNILVVPPLITEHRTATPRVVYAQT
jgi:hypothetical protein